MRNTHLAVIAALCLFACDDGATGGDDEPDARVVDLDMFSVPVLDGSFRLDFGRIGRDGGRGQAGFRESCEDNLDCQSGWCVPFEDGNVCTITCLDQGCPGGWGCHAVGNTQPDVVFICFPPGNRLCGVCVQDEDCPNGRCYALDGVNVCGLNCEDDTSCPSGHGCEEVPGDGAPQCTPRTQSCSCNASRAGEGRVCELTNEFGACIGRQVCDAEAGWGDCDAQIPAPETCNQIDDDCDGFADDIDGLGEVCEREVEVDGARIACAGRVVCTRESPAPVCTAPEPMAERCNFLDDDCDGEADEDFPERGALCDVGVGDCLRRGVFECAEDGDGVECAAAAGDPVEERCDSRDNDCDGLVDEGFMGLDDLCSVGVGACRRAGALRCTEDGAGAICTATPGDPAPEVCDGVDNDCDGTPDEGFEGLFEPCSAGVGACLRQGFTFCTDDGVGVACTAAAAAPVDELCNGVDDDCDGREDEAFDGLQAPCTLGEGLCQRNGVTVCSEDGEAVVCNARISEPGPEVCNGLDDDCDGTPDEDFPLLDQICEVGVGVCAGVGLYDCTPEGDDVFCSARAAEPGEDRCDGLDNDCDGQTDEDFPNVRTVCTAGDGQCERAGLFRCLPDGSATACDVVAGEPDPELCNQLDDDCDGDVDEDFEGVNDFCQRGRGACRRVGIQTCAEDGEDVVCSVVAGEPGPELCNRIDDDCDGAVDEAFPDLLTPCSGGQGLCERNGVQVCAPDGLSTVCDIDLAEPAAEACNGLDDDCDGETDEDFDGLNTACSAGVGVCARQGVRVCTAEGDGVECNAEGGAPADEICNGLDDDCDGTSDEAFAGLNRPCSAGRGLCARAGVTVCADGGQRVECDATPGDPEDEACDSLDNDCDGTSDEGFAGVGQVCSAGRGACFRGGVTTCTADGAGVACNVEAGAPAAELCDGVDNDCDGRADETFADLNEVCTDGRGACLRAGVRVCADGGAGTQCNAAAGAPADETCNGRDDDCDGRNDESFVGLNRPCSAGRGLCTRAGINVCAEGGAGVECDAEPGPPAAESCDSQDNDCDGRVDETFVGVGEACTAGQGACFRSGVATCTADGAGVACNAEPGAPAGERCDRVDNDCDGRTDETFADLNAVCTVGRGVCQRSGVRECNPGGDATDCNVDPGPAGDEVCNGLDDDCDGSSDEAWPQLGRACAVGLGVCRRSGVQVCDAGDRSRIRCDADVVPGGAETCDYQDDDCDGGTDEGFVDDQGRYVSPTNCGACGTTCANLWDPNPAAFGVAPRCAVIGGAAQCTYDCLNGFEDADGVPNNGCELVLDPDAIYVSTPENGGLDGNACGTVDAPCATIGRGLARAAGANRLRVRVSDGVYRESVSLRAGVDLLGGHHRTTWIREPALNRTVIEGTSAGPDKRTVSAAAINIPTTFDGFTVIGQQADVGGNSYGIHIQDCNAALQVSNNRVLGGNGGRGTTGRSGDSGDPGVTGRPGNNSFNVSSPQDICFRNRPAIRSVGGAGGVFACGNVNVNGGAGGGARCPELELQEGSGAVGFTGRGGLGGDGGWGMISPDPGTCIVSDGGPADPSGGLAGRAGADGTGGDGGAAGLGGLSGADWRGNNGTNGTSAGPGGGGGGGGSAAGVFVQWRAFTIDIGATGGGGGSAGCEGDPGLHGRAGGGAFGVFVVFGGAGPANAGAFPTLVDNTITRGLGGEGGPGGNGGAGGEGGPGGAGGLRGAPLAMDFCSLRGGTGGVGGRGGHAGGAGGGQGGVSFDIFVANDNLRTPAAYRDGNGFGRANDDPTHGIGGDGGNSSNSVTGPGEDGGPGLSGNVGALP